VLPYPAPATTAALLVRRPADLTEDQAKADLEALQKKYGALVVNFNNQQAELAACQKRLAAMEGDLAKAKAEVGSSADEVTASLREQLAASVADLRAVEASNMALQKKVNKLQVEHVSEEEVDQLFYALEVKEQQLEQAMQDKESLEQEVLTARQLSARGGAGADPKFIEIHHHNDISDDDDDDDAPAAAPVS
jgi:bifunctional ADP-heptose synthase (sugar kinase/adenylyltransferase)